MLTCRCVDAPTGRVVVGGVTIDRNDLAGTQPKAAVGRDVVGHEFLSGGGELGRLIADYDWAQSSIGPIAAWPQSLKTVVALILRSKVPLVTLWGTEGVMIYNDAYSVFAAARHPRLLGAKVREGWPEVADFNDNVMKVGLSGGTLAYQDQELTLFRSGRPEQVWMNLDYSPILDELGQPAGVMAIVVETTEKVVAERWQSSERDRQRQMFEQAPGFMAMMSGPEHVFDLTNNAFLLFAGRREILGKPVRAAFPEIDGQGFFEILDQVYATGVPFVGQSLKAQLQPTPNMPIEERSFDLAFQPVRNSRGNVVGIFMQGVDVTERLVAENSLRQSVAEFRTLAEAMPNHVWTASQDGRLDWCNPRVYQYSGANSGELTGDGWTRIVHPSDLPSANKAWSDALASGAPYETEFRLRRADGVYRWHIARAVPIDTGDTRLKKWIGTNTDIDDQKRAAEALHESERRLQLSQSAAGIGSLEMDIATGTVIGSDNFWNLWGLSKRDSVPISVLESLVIDEDSDIRSSAETRVNGTAVPNVEYRIRRADTGEVRWLSRHIDFVRDGANKPIKMFGVMQDITDRKAAQSRQDLLTHELEHRIKNILSIVQAIASQTLRGAELTGPRTEFEKRLRALSNAHDLLNSTRWTNASMREVITRTVAAFPVSQFQISGPNLLINPKMALTLALVVNELGTNAVKYGALSTPKGNVSIEWKTEIKASLDDSTLTWRWREAGGPPVRPPSRSGFGTLLVERVFGADFGGVVRIDYHPDGVDCVLACPLPISALIHN